MDEASPWQNVRRHTPRPTETNRRNSRVAGYSDTPLPTHPPPNLTTHPLTSLSPYFPIPHPHERTPNPRSLVSLPPYTQVRPAAARRRGSEPGAAARVGWQLGHGSNRAGRRGLRHQLTTRQHTTIHKLLTSHHSSAVQSAADRLPSPDLGRCGE